MRRFVLVTLAAIALLAAPAVAFDLDPMNRAYPMMGNDLVSGKTVDLEDYRGKWVLLEFWASW